MESKAIKIIESKMELAGLNPSTIAKEISFAIQLHNENKTLQKCSVQSFQKAVINIANIGLSLNPAKKEAYLIPRYNRFKREFDAVLEPSYIGLIKLACEGTETNSIVTNVVHENDQFSVNIAASKDPVKHSPSFKDRGAVIGVYAIANFNNGTSQVEWVSIEDIESIRANSEGYKAYLNDNSKKSVWVSWFGEMARKAAVKRLCKYLSGASSNDNLTNAIELDNSDYMASMGQIQYIESLLMDTEAPSYKVSEIYNEIQDSLSHSRASQIIGYLKENEPKNIVEYNGGAGSQKELDAAIKNRIDREN